MRVMKQYDVGMTGSVAGVDVALAAQLHAAGLTVSVLRYNRNEGPAAWWQLNHLKGFLPSEIEYADSGGKVLAWARKCRCIISSSATLAFGLGRWWMLRNFLGLPPVIAKCTGADICELAMQQGDKADRYRESLQHSAVIWGIPYREGIENLHHLGHDSRTFIPSIYAGSGRLAGPKLVYHPFPVLLPGLEVPPWARWSLGPLSQPMTIFHPGNIEWGTPTAAGGRSSLKGTDRFLSATLRAMDDGLRADVHILDRGPDRERARALINSSKHSALFHWHEERTRLQLLTDFVGSDLVVDSFGIGALGFCGMEAMSVGAPVMCYVDRESEAVTYTSQAPVFNVSTEPEIYDQLMRLGDRRELLKSMADKGREWIEQNHGSAAIAAVKQMVWEVQHGI